MFVLCGVCSRWKIIFECVELRGRSVGWVVDKSIGFFIVYSIGLFKDFKIKIVGLVVWIKIFIWINILEYVVSINSSIWSV